MQCLALDDEALRGRGHGCHDLCCQQFCGMLVQLKLHGGDAEHARVVVETEAVIVTRECSGQVLLGAEQLVHGAVVLRAIQAMYQRVSRVLCAI